MAKLNTKKVSDADGYHYEYEVVDNNGTVHYSGSNERIARSMLSTVQRTERVEAAEEIANRSDEADTALRRNTGSDASTGSDGTGVYSDNNESGAMGGTAETTTPDIGNGDYLASRETDSSVGPDSSVSVATMDPDNTGGVNHGNEIAPWDVRLARTDMFLVPAQGSTAGRSVPLSNLEVASMVSDMVDYAMDGNGGTDPKFVVPANKGHWKMLLQNENLYGTTSIVNPYSITRIYNGLGGITGGKNISAQQNRMLDIRDQKRFYDINITTNVTSGDNDSNVDVLSVSNPTTSNIIKAMNADKWGRTPYSYQDFVFCKYWNRIPNNRLITLRKYTSPTYDNLCWEHMNEAGNDQKLEAKFSPVCTAVTFFGGESGNSLKDIFKIKTGVKWKDVSADIWTVQGDSGTVETGNAVEDAARNSFGLGQEFSFIGKVGTGAIQMAKLLGIMRDPNAFDQNGANVAQKTAALHDPNENGPLANRIRGPLNRISSVMARQEGIEFSNDIVLQFNYIARPIGNINTKVAMLDILSNMLLMCSATAVFWGGGHRFMITPHAYPWKNAVGDGLIKNLYHGRIFGKKGAIYQTLHGFVSSGLNDNGEWSWSNAMNTLKQLGLGVLGALGTAINTLVSSISGSNVDVLSSLSNLAGMGGDSKAAMAAGGRVLDNIMKNGQHVWQANSMKMSTLPWTEGMRSVLLGVPVGNWHLTVGNPLNPIAVIGNLVCKDMQIEFGEELGPDDFPLELKCTVTLAHGMARDKAAIESMFNRGAGRIYQAPDYVRMMGLDATSSDQETRVDAVTGGATARTPVKWSSMAGAGSGYGSYKLSEGRALSNAGSVQIQIPGAKVPIIDYDYALNTRQVEFASRANMRTVYKGNMFARKMVDE